MFDNELAFKGFNGGNRSGAAVLDARNRFSLIQPELTVSVTAPSVNTDTSSIKGSLGFFLWF